MAMLLGTHMMTIVFWILDTLFSDKTMWFCTGYIYIHIYISVYRTCLRSDLKASHILVLLGFGGRPNKNTCHGESLKFGYHPPAIYHSSGKWSMYR